MVPDADGYVTVPDRPGIGFELNMDLLNRYKLSWEISKRIKEIQKQDFANDYDGMSEVYRFQNLAEYYPLSWSIVGILPMVNVTRGVS